MIKWLLRRLLRRLLLRRGQLVEGAGLLIASLMGGVSDDLADALIDAAELLRRKG